MPSGLLRPSPPKKTKTRGQGKPEPHCPGRVHGQLGAGLWSVHMDWADFREDKWSRRVRASPDEAAEYHSHRSVAILAQAVSAFWSWVPGAPPLFACSHGRPFQEQVAACGLACGCLGGASWYTQREAHDFLAQTRHDCPRVLGSLDDLDPAELRTHLDRAAQKYGVPDLADGDFQRVLAVVQRAGALRSHGIRRSAVLAVKTRPSRGLMIQRGALQILTSWAALVQAVWEPPPLPKGGRWPSRLARARAEGGTLT